MTVVSVVHKGRKSTSHILKDRKRDSDRVGGPQPKSFLNYLDEAERGPSYTAEEVDDILERAWVTKKRRNRSR